eukprot:365531-Chlamydomonas_euryale.AAC.5
MVGRVGRQVWRQGLPVWAHWEGFKIGIAPTMWAGPAPQLLLHHTNRAYAFSLVQCRVVVVHTLRNV